ncbi:MAG: hypothetical protein U0133_06020 [Gemmatimonadales bacterium]
MTKPRSGTLAALASLTMPGLGQLYNGQPTLALVFFIGYWAIGLLYTLRVIALLAAPNPATATGGTTGPFLGMTVIWLVGVVQAVQAARAQPDYELKPYNNGFLYTATYLLAYIALPLLAALPLAKYAVRVRGNGELPDSVATTSVLAGLLRQARQSQAGDPVDLKIDIPDPEAAAASATTVFHVALVGGPDGGIYDATSSEAVCTRRADPAAPSWAGLYANPSDTAGLTAIQFRIPIAEGETNDFQLSVNRGSGDHTRSYLIDGRRPWGEDGKGRASVERRGDGATIRVDATTENGVRVEVVIQCRRIATE